MDPQAGILALARQRLGTLRAKWTFALRLVLALGILAALLGGGWLDPRAFRSLRPDAWLFGAILSLLGTLLLPPLRWWILCRGRGLRLGLRAVIHMSVIGSIAGRILLGAVTNDAVRLTYIGRLLPARRALAISTVLVDRYLGMLALLALGPSALGLLWLRGVREPWVLSCSLVVVGLFVAALLLPLMVSKPAAAKLLGPLRRSRFVAELHQALIGYRGHLPALAAGFLISLLTQTAYLAGCCFAVKALGNALDPVAVAAVIPIIVLSRQIPLTPLGLGIGEGVAEQLFRLTHMEGGAEMALLVRAILIGQAILCLPTLLVPVGASPQSGSEGTGGEEAQASDPDGQGQQGVPSTDARPGEGGSEAAREIS